MDPQKVGIVGMGPVGSILGAYLVKSGMRVYGVEPNQARADQVNRQGLVVTGFTQLREKPEQCFADLGSLARIEGLSAVFICTKTWAIKSVMTEFMSHTWPEDMRIAAFMNGIGPEDAIGEYISKERICRGVVNYAGNLQENGEVTMNWFHPPNLIGPATHRNGTWLPHLEKALNSAGLTTVHVTHHEMKKAAFYKTVLNSALNALCAAHGLTMAQAMRLKHTRRMARILMREGLTVAGLVGYNYGEDALYESMEYLESGGDHYPSMWFDLKNGLPTEIEFINGKIVKIGHMFKDINVAVNAFFTSTIITEEIRHGTRAEDDIPDYLVNT